MIDNKETRRHWWSFKDCGHYVAFFSEKKMAVWYARLYALVSKRDYIPEVVPIFELGIVAAQEDLLVDRADSQLRGIRVVDPNLTPSQWSDECSDI